MTGVNMANMRRGEIEAEIDGQTYVLCLTLGALAELEHRLSASNLVELGARFEKGHLSANEMMAIIGAGLRGAGASFTDDDVGRMSMEGGITQWAMIAARLLQASFGQGEASTPNP
jgi:hypothetical protein